MAQAPSRFDSYKPEIVVVRNLTLPGLMMPGSRRMHVMPHKVLFHEDLLIGAHTGEDLGVDLRANVQKAKRIISGLEGVPTFDKHLIETIAAPPGYMVTLE